MQKNLLSIMIGLLSFITTNAQQTIIDSLKNELNLAQGDLAKAKIHIDISYQYVYIDAAEGIAHADYAIKIAEQLQNDSLIGYGYNRKAMHIISNRQDSLAFEMLERAISHFKKINHAKGHGTTLYLIGWLHNARREYPKAIKVFLEADEIYYRESEDPKRNAIYNNIGVAYLQTADYKKAIDAYFQALRIAKNANPPLPIGVIYGNIGLVHKHMKDYDNALKYFALAEAEYKKEQSIENRMDNYGHMAITYDEMGQTDQAILYFEKAIEESDAANYEFGSSNNRFNRGVLLLHQGRFKDAFEPITKGRDYYENAGYYKSAATANQTLAEFYLQLPDSLFSYYQIPNQKNAYEKAKEVLLKAIKQSRNAQNDMTLMESMRLLAMVWDKIGNADSALFALKEYQRMYGEYTTRDIDNKTEVIKQDMAFQNEQREQVLQAETDKQRTIKMASILVGGSLILLALATLWFYKKKRDSKAKELTAEFNTVVSETEMKALRSQMNPHFIFNSLNSISLYIQKNELKLADSYLVKFAKLMRLILENSEHKEVSIKKDMEALELYMQLEQVRLKNNFTYSIRIDDSIDTEGTLIPPLLLQPFVENSIWHGISTVINGHISVEIQLQDEQLICIVDDNGIGRNKSNQTNKEQTRQSLGMKITRSRIEILNKTKQAQAAIHIFDKEQGTRVETKLPLELKY